MSVIRFICWFVVAGWSVSLSWLAWAFFVDYRKENEDA